MKTSTKTRNLVKKRAQSRCELCGLGSDRWHYHHRRPRGAGGTTTQDSDSPSNVLLTHPRCHLNVIERKRMLAIGMGWLVPQGVDPATFPVRLYDGWYLLNDEGEASKYG